MKNFKRAHRVSSLVREIVGELITCALHDPEARKAVITEVALGDDLRLATIRYQVVGGSPDLAQVGLERARSFLRRELGRRLKMKLTPDLRFQYDNSLDATEHIDAILNKLHIPDEETS
jgi:ribosome-binding factor A